MEYSERNGNSKTEIIEKIYMKESTYRLKHCKRRDKLKLEVSDNYPNKNREINDIKIMNGASICETILSCLICVWSPRGKR